MALPNLLDSHSQSLQYRDPEVDSDVDPRLFPGKDCDGVAPRPTGFPNQRSALVTGREALGEYQRCGVLGEPLAQETTDGPPTTEGLPLWRRALVRASYHVHRANSAVKRFAEKGPVSVSTLSIVAGSGTSICGIVNLIGFFFGEVNAGSVLLNAYMILFGAVTILLEMDVDALPAAPVMQDVVVCLSQAQTFLHQKVQLLTEFRGRSAFYIYQGSMLMSQGCTHSLLFVVGLYNVFVGILCAWMAWEAAWNATEDGQANVSCRVGSTTGHSTRQTQQGEDPEIAFGALPDYDFQAAKRAYERDEKSIKGRLQIDLYGLLQQTEIGDCESKRPGGLMNSVAKAKWDAWNQLRGMPSSAAKTAFVERLTGAGIRT